MDHSLVFPVKFPVSFLLNLAPSLKPLILAKPDRKISHELNSSSGRKLKFTLELSNT